MERVATARTVPHVVIAGGGIAAIETLLALRALGNEQFRITLVAPQSTFFYRPAATVQAFEDAAPRAYDLDAIVAQLDVVYRQSRLAFVGSHKRYVRLSSGERLSYDALVLATGARATAAVAGALMFRDHRDVPTFRRLLSEVEQGLVGRLVFAVPTGCCWPLPLYELALMSATHAAEFRVGTEVIVVTPERAPLTVFGPEPSRLVADVLAERGVSFIGTSVPDQVCDDGSLALASGRRIEADRVLAIPQLWGRLVPGIPANRAGFVPTDASGRVQGLADVYAAGDATAFPIKQGGVAAQQADRIAQVILAAAGVSDSRRRIPSVLEARLIGGARPVVLRAELDQHGHATRATLTRAASEASVKNKVMARFLTPYLEGIPTAAHTRS